MTDSHPPLLEFAVDLYGIDVDRAGLVSLEATRQTTFMRFACGSVSDPSPLHGVSLDEFIDATGIVFRLKVTAASGQLLAVADRLRPVTFHSETSAAEGLLPFRAADLGSLVWRLDLSDDHPVVTFNERLGDWRSVATSPQFDSLVLPEIVRQIGRWLIDRETSEPEDDASVEEWRGFALSLGVGRLDEEHTADARDAWIEDLAARFSAKHGLLDQVSIFVDRYGE